MRSVGILSLLVGTAFVLGGAMTQEGLALFTSQATVTGNSFETAASFGSCTAGDTGFLNPMAEVADTGGDGDGFELNPTNAFADDAAFASNINGNGDRHRFYNYGVSIPAGCAIAGIEVRLDWWLDTTGGVNSMSAELSWDGGTSWTTAKTDAIETASQHTVILGGSADTWARTWAISDFSDANFRVRLISTGANARDFFLDWVPVTVYYVP